MKIAQTRQGKEAYQLQGMMNYLLETYTTDDVIAEGAVEIPQFTQPSNFALTVYAEDLCSKMIGCNLVYDEYVLKEIINEGLIGSIRHRMC